MRLKTYIIKTHFSSKYFEFKWKPEYSYSHKQRNHWFFELIIFDLYFQIEIWNTKRHRELNKNEISKYFKNKNNFFT